MLHSMLDHSASVAARGSLCARLRVELRVGRCVGLRVGSPAWDTRVGYARDLCHDGRLCDSVDGS